MKDSRGFMWFGTQNGITRYDGTNFVIYENDPKNPNSLNHNIVNAIIEDDDKNIWIGTSEGLNLYNRDKDNFTHFKYTYGNIVANSLCADNNTIWIGTTGTGLIQYNVKSGKFKTYIHDENNANTINSNFVNSIIKNKDHTLWLGTWNGLDLFNIKENKFTHFVNNPNDPGSISNNFVNALFLDKDGELWIGTLNGGLNRLSFTKDKYYFKRYPYFTYPGNFTTSNIISLYTDQNSKLWIGTDNGGLYCLNKSTGEMSNYFPEAGNLQNISGSTIRTLYVDDLNILWIGTFNKGINFFDERYNRFEEYKKNPNSKFTLNEEDVRGFCEDNQGNVLIATNDGISKFNISTRQFTKTITNKPEEGRLSTNAVTSVIFDTNENLWVGTWDEGIDRLNKNLVKTANYKIKGIQKTGDNKVLCLYQDKKKNIWAGSAGCGLFRYNKSSDSFIQIYDKKRAVRKNDPVYVSSVIEDSHNHIWVSTLYGLFRLQQTDSDNYTFESFYHSDNPGSISSNGVSIVFEDRDKNIWVGTIDKGLNLYNRKTNSFTIYQKQDGLPNNNICGILQDNKGNLWISTNKGISKFEISSKRFKNFTTDDGLVSNEFYGGSCLKSRSGEFLFGSNEGFNLFLPDSIKDNKLLPPIYLTGFKIFNKSAQIGVKGSPLTKSISETRKIILTHKQSSFTIDFVALNYIHGSKNEYAYILDGLEKEWNYVGHAKSATYTYVRPGKYLFKVKGSNNDGIWNDTPATLEIVILPPFWQTYWAYSAYLIIFLILVIAFIRYRIKRAKEIHLLELNKMKLQFFANISHELRTPLSLIISPIENILSSVKDNNLLEKLSLVYKNADRLMRLVNEIMDFTKAEESKLTVSAQSGDIVKYTHEIFKFFSDEASRRDIKYEFITDSPDIEAWFDADKWEKIIVNLLSNAFKFTPDKGFISLKIEKLDIDNTLTIKRKSLYRKNETNGILKISITNSGKGIPSDELEKVFERFYQSKDEDHINHGGTGIGLSLTKALVELHHGKISVTSEKWKETCFNILLPLGNKHFKDNELSAEPYNLPSKTFLLPVFARKKEQKNPAIPLNLPTVLLVEDNFDLRKYILTALHNSYIVLEANDGDAGYSIATEQIPDLIISDIIMPKLTGIELCKKLKENILTSHIPIILLTARSAIEDQIKGIETGADAYITKPFNVQHLEAVIKNLIENRQKIFQRFSQEVYILPKEISSNPIDQEFLEKVIAYIEDNIASPELSVENLASHLLMSSSNTWRKIKSLTGQSTNEFIRTIRLKKAIKLIEEKKYNVSDIAYQVGFTSPAYFTKCFRKQYGKTPSEYFLD